MTKLFTFLIFAFLSANLSAQMKVNSVFAAADSKIKVMGRYEITENKSVKFGSSGVTFFIRFKGTELKAVLKDEFKYGNSYNYFLVLIDGKIVKKFRTVPAQVIYSLAENLSDKIHSAQLIKLTEGQNGWNELVQVECGDLQDAVELPTQKIEFIGDSITCGFGDDDSETPCGKGSWFDQHNAFTSYAITVSGMLKTQYMLSSISGMGMYRNWNNPGPVISDIYRGIYFEAYDSLSRWDFKKYQPDLITICLGTNDFSDGDQPQPREKVDSVTFIQKYTNFIRLVRQNNPNSKILLLSSPMLDKERNSKLIAYLNQVVKIMGNEGVTGIYTFTFAKRYINGCNGHPNEKEQKQMAEELIDKLKSVLKV